MLATGFLLTTLFVTASCFETSEIVILTHSYLNRPPENLSPEVTFVDLSYNNIAELNASSFQKNNSIQVLRICYNELRTVDDYAFKHLYSLSYVDLSHNGLTNLDPEAFASNAALRTVILSHNPLGDVEGLPLLSSSSVQHLMADHSSFRAFSAASFSRLPLLQTLSLLETKAQAFKLDSAVPLVGLQQFSFSSPHRDCYDTEAFSGLLYLARHHVYHGLPFCDEVFTTNNFIWVLSGLIVLGLLCLIFVVALKSKSSTRNYPGFHHC